MSRHRSHLPRLLSLALTCAAFAATPPISAQSSAAAGSSAGAEELLARGVELRQTNHDTEALALFRQALELEPESCRALANLGTTYQALGRWVLADTYLTQALSHGEDNYVQRHREALEQAREYVNDHLGLLEVQGGPAGAEVRINGQRLARLPMAEPVRVPVGAYQLEVSLGGHYGFNEPVRVSSRALTRETVELLPLSAGAHAGIPSSTPGGATAAVGREPSSVPGWVPWTLAGVGVAAAAVGTVAWIQRQDHADRWHDDSACLNVPGATRASLCGDERTRGLRAQTIALTSGGLALGFATAAVWTALAGSADTEEEVGLASCGIGLGDLNCSGHF